MGMYYNPIDYDDCTAVNSVDDDQICGWLSYLKQDGHAGGLTALLSEGLNIFDGNLGIDLAQIATDLCREDPSIAAIDIKDYYYDVRRINEELKEYLPEDREWDPRLIFGKLYEGSYGDLIDFARLEREAEEISAGRKAILYGYGAAAMESINRNARVFYFDVTPKDSALIINRGRYVNIGSDGALGFDEMTRRAYFIDAELMTGLRRELLQKDAIDYYILHSAKCPYAIMDRQCLKSVAAEFVRRPFRAKPIYVEGVWGGQFIKRERQLPDEIAEKVAWSFELLPMEASALIQVRGMLLDIPFFALMNLAGRQIIGENLYRKYGGYFPVRANYDDTWHSDGNMSIQCHPDEEQARTWYNELGGQNEAYYVVVTGHDSKVFCGFRGDGKEFLDLCRRSEQDGRMIDYEKYVNHIESRPGTQVFIPAGTIHASGRNQLVLELGSVMIGGYTYKMYDYNRREKDGRLRPIHTKLAETALKTERDREWVNKNSVIAPVKLQENESYSEYRIGFNEQMDYETHRINLKTCRTYQGQNNGKFTMLAVVDGEAVQIRAKDNPEYFYRAKYLDVVIVPSTISEYEIVAEGKQPVVIHKTVIRER